MTRRLIIGLYPASSASILHRHPLHLHNLTSSPSASSSQSHIIVIGGFMPMTRISQPVARCIRRVFNTRTHTRRLRAQSAHTRNPRVRPRAAGGVPGRWYRSPCAKNARGLSLSLSLSLSHTHTHTACVRVRVAQACAVRGRTRARVEPPCRSADGGRNAVL
jgi:hypothetical protein